MSQLEAKGIKATMPVTEFRPGVTISMVTDPDGTNTVVVLTEYRREVRSGAPGHAGNMIRAT